MLPNQLWTFSYGGLFDSALTGVSLLVSALPMLGMHTNRRWMSVWYPSMSHKIPVLHFPQKPNTCMLKKNLLFPCSWRRLERSSLHEQLFFACENSCYEWMFEVNDGHEFYVLKLLSFILNLMCYIFVELWTYSHYRVKEEDSSLYQWI